MAKKVSIRLLKVPLWPVDIWIIIGGDHNNVKTVALDKKCSMAVMVEIERDKLTTKDARGGAYFCQDTGNGILWFPHKTIQSSTLAHEITHIVDGILEYIGADKEAEARAYTVDWLVTWVPLIARGVKKRPSIH